MTAPFTTLLSHLRGQADPHGAPADAVLLADFVSGRDGSAYAELVARHGPMVWRVCRRVLGGPLEAEDAFQATFLVLARKAGAVRRPAELAGWLYGVALRVARKARGAAFRRRLRQQPEAPEPAGRDRCPLAELSA